MSIPKDSESQYQIFRDCVFEAITNKSTLSNDKKTPSRRRRDSRKESKSVSEVPVAQESAQAIVPFLDDPSSLADFSDYLATETFLSLPKTLRTLNYHSATNSPSHDYSLPLTSTLLEDITSHLPPSIPDTLTTYSLVKPPTTDTQSFLSPVLTSYITTLRTPPPPPSSTRPSTNECELCSRSHLPLTYHRKSLPNPHFPSLCHACFLTSPPTHDTRRSPQCINLHCSKVSN